jgi:hypothetical protein
VRPLLDLTRQEIEAFLRTWDCDPEENSLPLCLCTGNGN